MLDFTARQLDPCKVSMVLDQYLQLPAWTGRQIRKHRVGVIPSECAPSFTTGLQWRNGARFCQERPETPSAIDVA